MTNILKLIRNLGKNERPLLSVIIAFYNMEREAPRTLFSLSTGYQKGVAETDYEVIAVDCGSTIPMNREMVRSFGNNFSLVNKEFSPSPVRAINQAVAGSKGNYVMVCIDGARIFSPGILHYTLAAFRAFHRPVVITPNLHLGSKIQKEAMLEGYNQVVEDQLLATVDWKNNGYELFRISCFGGSGNKGWFGAITESNSIAMSRDDFDRLGGLCEAFLSPGGGFANIDLFQRAAALPNTLVMLLGEGTFHQFHNGISTNAPVIFHPVKEFIKEYEAIRSRKFVPNQKQSVLMGKLYPQMYPLLSYSAEKVFAGNIPETLALLPENAINQSKQ